VVYVQGGSNMTGTDLCVNKPQSVPVIFEPPCTNMIYYSYIVVIILIAGEGNAEEGSTEG